MTAPKQATQETLTIPIDWSPRDYQLPVYTFFENGGKRAACVWHRRSGKDLVGENIIAPNIVTRPGLYWHILPTYNQGRKAIWDGVTRDGRRFIDHLPVSLASSINNTEMKITWPNNAIYQVVGGEYPDRLVGSNPFGVIFSEWPLMNPKCWDYIRPILAENGGWALFLYTPRGRNHGYELYEMALRNENWFAELLTVDDTRVISQDIIDEERKSGMSEAMIQQEFYCSFDAPLEGSYYGNIMNRLQAQNQIGAFPADAYTPTYTAWDIGIGDQTVIVFFQYQGKNPVIVDCYANSGEGLAHYVKILKERPYHYEEHFVPHDFMARDLSTGKSRYEIAREMGLNVYVLPRMPVDDGIEAVRGMLPTTYIHRSEETKYLIWALSEYRKEYDEKLRVYKTRPLHDWSSDYADAVRTMAWAQAKLKPKKQEVIQTHVEDEFEF